MGWNPYEHSDEDNSRRSLLRAIEWKNYPLFISLVFVGPMVFFYGWGPTLAIFFFCNFFWGLVAMKLVNLSVMHEVAFFVTILKWISIVPFAIYFIVNQNYIYAGLLLTYPFWSPLLGVASVKPIMIGSIQKVILAKLGYP